ncbi:MAG: ABC-2 family transporter protein [Clostridia bacterium]|nr:ABC-2 family transporter protein [Clostridia bacterium]
MINEIKKYWAFGENSIKEQYAYKLRSFIWTVFFTLNMLIQYFVWKAVFESNNGVFYNISLKQYISYIGIGLIVTTLSLSYQYLFIAGEVRNGNVAMSLIKPISFNRLVFAKHVGWKVGELINLIPIVIIVFFVTGANTVSPLVFFEFALSVVFAFIISYLFSYLLGILTFWITNYWGLHLLRLSLSIIFSGQVIAIPIYFKIGEGGMTSIPIPFLSSDFVAVFFKMLGFISYILPFQTMYFTPTGIYTGLISGEQQVFFHLFLQAFWIVFLYLLIKFVWKKVQNDITILGG